MTEANTPAVEPEVEETNDKSSETRLFENIANNMDKFPAKLDVVRNEVTKVFGKTQYRRGDKKEAGLCFVGPVEKVEVDNLESWIKFFGIEKVCSILNNAITAIAIATSERAVGDDMENGTYNEEILTKGLTEFSSAGESTKDLVEKLKEAQNDFIEWQKKNMSNPELLTNTNHPLHKSHMAQLQEISDTMLYCQSNIANRKRGPRKAKA